MSEPISDTAKLDEAQKEPETKREEYFTNLKNFVSSTFSSGLRLLFGFIISLFLIYACKISQANVLPSDINCFPYTKEVNNPKEIQTNIFTNSPFSKPRKSMKMTFDVEGSEFVNSMLKSFRDYKEENTSSFLGMYFYSIMESMFMKNYSFYSYILTFVDVLPEFILVFFGPYIGLCILILSCIYNAIYFIWYWFSNLTMMWKKNASIQINKTTGNVEYTGPPRWVDVRWGYTKTLPDGSEDKNSTEWGNVVVGLIFIILFIWLFFILALIQGLIFIPILFNLIVLYSFLTYNMKLENNDASFTNLFQYFFRYNKLLVMTCFAGYVVYNAYTYLGATSAVFAVLTIFLIYYLKIIEMFVSVGTEDERTSPLASTRQAKKVACEKPKPEYVTPNDESVPLLDKKEEGSDEATGAGEATGSGEASGAAPGKKSWRDSFSFMKSKSQAKPESNPEGNPEGSKDIELTDMSGEKPAEPQKSRFSFGKMFSSKKTPAAGPEGTSTSAEGASTSAEGESTSGEGAPAPAEGAQPEKKGFFSSMKMPSMKNPFGQKPSQPPISSEGNITKTQGQLGGYKTKQIGGDQLIRELKKFNKKYAAFLL